MKYSNHITFDDRHVPNSYFVPGGRSQYMKCKTNRFRDSFLPFAIHCHNTHAYVMLLYLDDTKELDRSHSNSLMIPSNLI